MTTETTTTIQDLARIYADAMERCKRQDGTTYWRFKDDAPEDAQDLAFHVHGDMFPDDWRYAFLQDALETIADADDPEEIEVEASIYNHDLAAWLGSHSDRPGYVDEACREFSYHKDVGIIDRIQLGQWQERREVADLALGWLEERTEA